MVRLLATDFTLVSLAGCASRPLVAVFCPHFYVYLCMFVHSFVLPDLNGKHSRDFDEIWQVGPPEAVVVYCGKLDPGDPTLPSNEPKTSKMGTTQQTVRLPELLLEDIAFHL